MIRFLADENFNGKVLRGVKLRQPQVDIVRVQDTELFQAEDLRILEWAANEKRILLTHDRETMVGFVTDRLEAGLPVAGVVFAKKTLPIGDVIEDLLTIWGASEMSDWENRIVFLPL